MTKRQITAAVTVVLAVAIVVVDLALIAFGCPTISRPIKERTGADPVVAAAGFVCGAMTVHLLGW